MTKNSFVAQVTFKKRESTDLKHFNDSKSFIEYSNDMDGI